MAHGSLLMEGIAISKCLLLLADMLWASISIIRCGEGKEITIVFLELILLVEFGLVQELYKAILIIGICSQDSSYKYMLASVVDSMELLQVINSGLETDIMLSGKRLTDGSRISLSESMEQLLPSILIIKSIKNMD